MEYIIAIDCGATKSEAIIVPINKLINLKKLDNYKSYNFPFVNYNLLGFNESVSRIRNIVYFFKNKELKINIITAGISGARFQKDRKKLAKELKKQTGVRNVFIFTDADIAFEAEFNNNIKNCGILIAGTGSILYIKHNSGLITRIGGWGRLIGDEGSGYWIARKALSLVTKHYDNIIKYYKLTEILEKKFSITKNNLIDKIYSKGFDIQMLTKYVFQLAILGDKISKKIIKDAAIKLAEHFKPLGNSNYKIALTGSLFIKNDLLSNELIKICKKIYPNIKLIKSNHKPVIGALKKSN